MKITITDQGQSKELIQLSTELLLRELMVRRIRYSTSSVMESQEIWDVPS